ncbi:MAG: prepilin-type N-terminal cleavage/methylation domain-containing protein [Candidatus Omnitrophica bacterium]|nr:prepilin-type N-terminal cleavage/methylation domain-containing protein [Candidatus Omnitrophota bacterium]
MTKKLTQSGFTLIEIIVVLIIVGVLAAIALPNLFNNVQRAQAGEAIAALGVDKSMVEGCIMGHASAAGDACASMAFTDTPNFKYAFAPAPTNANQGGNYVITATATDTGNTVSLTKNYTTGALTCSGGGAFKGVC